MGVWASRESGVISSHQHVSALHAVSYLERTGTLHPMQEIPKYPTAYPVWKGIEVIREEPDEVSATLRLPLDVHDCPITRCVDFPIGTEGDINPIVEDEPELRINALSISAQNQLSPLPCLEPWLNRFEKFCLHNFILKYAESPSRILAGDNYLQNTNKEL